MLINVMRYMKINHLVNTVHKLQRVRNWLDSPHLVCCLWATYQRFPRTEKNNTAGKGRISIQMPSSSLNFMMRSFVCFLFSNFASKNTTYFTRPPSFWTNTILNQWGMLQKKLIIKRVAKRSSSYINYTLECLGDFREHMITRAKMWFYI